MAAVYSNFTPVHKNVTTEYVSITENTLRDCRGFRSWLCFLECSAVWLCLFQIVSRRDVKEFLKLHNHANVETCCFYATLTLTRQRQAWRAQACRKRMSRTRSSSPPWFEKNVLEYVQWGKCASHCSSRLHTFRLLYIWAWLVQG